MTRQVAIIDFDPKTNELSPPVPFDPGPKMSGAYAVADPTALSASDFTHDPIGLESPH